jgi:hypothetical protein
MAPVSDSDNRPDRPFSFQAPVRKQDGLRFKLSRKDLGSEKDRADVFF